jgi:hypothetical protein
MAKVESFIKPKRRLKYSEREKADLMVVFSTKPMSKPKVVAPGKIIFEGATVQPSHCDGDSQQAARLNEYFKRLVQEGKAMWEQVPDSEAERELAMLNQGLDSVDDNADTNSGANGTVE